MTETGVYKPALLGLGIHMFSKLLGKRKRRDDDPLGGIELDDSIDLESGTIYIDDTIDPERVVKGSEVFDQKDDKPEDAAPTSAPTEKKSTIAGGGAKIFLLDLAPFFKAIGTKKGDRAADSFTRFAENWLTRCIGTGGVYELVDGDVFFFRLNMPNREAAKQAVQIVNDIGTQYLRDAYKADVMLQDILGAVDAGLAAGRNGRIDAGGARDILKGWRTIEGRKLAASEVLEWGHSKTREDLAGYMVPIQTGRKASERVQRGPERRKVAKAISGQDRRRRKHGRRESDKPGAKSVWR